jgi:hypothetical protein
MPGFAFDRRFPFDVKRVPGHDSDSVFELHTACRAPLNKVNMDVGRRKKDGVRARL